MWKVEAFFPTVTWIMDVEVGERMRYWQHSNVEENVEKREKNFNDPTAGNLTVG